MSDDLAAFLLACLYKAQGRAEAQLGIDNERAEFELADIDAKRAILDVHHNMNGGDCAVCVVGEWGYPTNGGSSPALWPCTTVKLLALPYAGRDGWRDEWRPE